jgi:hypothetical protein
MPLEIQPRDRAMMKFIYAFRVASFSQIQKRYFANVFRTAGPRRIRQLADAGYLKVVVAGDENVTHQFTRLTDKAWPEIRELWPFEVNNPLFKSESPVHDLRLAELFFSFEKLSTFNQLLTENLLQTSSAIAEDPKFGALAKLQADGALVVKPPRSDAYVYGVELETSKKAPERYRDKLLNYYIAGGLDGVLYISDSQVTLDAVARADAEIRSKRESILHLALEKNVLASNGKIYFHKVQGGGIELF